MSTETPVNAWIRANEHLDSRKECLCIGDCDLWVLRYGVRRRGTVERDTAYLMLVEVKTHGRDLNPAQRDLMMIVNDVTRTVGWRGDRDNGRLEPGHPQTAREVYSLIAGRRIQVLSYGVHKLRLNGATPDNSDIITWDFKTITRTKLVQVLKFELSPDSLRRMEHRSHKRISELPALFNLNPNGVS